MVVLEEPHIVDHKFILKNYVPELYINTLHNPCYLPENPRRNCLQPTRIEATIESDEDLASFTDKDKKELVEYSKNNPRLFLILAVSSLIRKLPLLLRGKFTEADLPVKMKWCKDKFVVHSVSDPKEFPWTCFEIEEGKKDTPKTWLSNDVTAFTTHQWAFSAAVLEPGRFDYEFHHKCPLPYVDLSNESDAESPGNNHSEGHFATVFRLGLRADHISSVNHCLPIPIHDFFSFSKRAQSEADHFHCRHSILKSHPKKSRSRN